MHAWVKAGMPGIIPACAGSTSGEPRQQKRRGDHPRVRGEHSLLSKLNRIKRGSSPRARGARRHPTVKGPRMGIIPACAGSTGAAG